ncbi:MAG TPA: ATP-grasp domain-containing protein [Burkholderiaceae bacterium]|jgi:predicted ATP-grasp superfamily ATP-dependent carboligase|nr:ATP-grasp domain-containing protein [Burkholderiaceae bacterium]
MMKKRIFVYEYLSGGGLVAGDDELLDQGRAMRDAIVEDLARIDGVEITCASGEHSRTAPGSPRVTLVQPQSGESPFDFVWRQTRAHDLAWVVAPETGGLLACLRKIVPQQRWVGCDSASIRLASSKSATLEELSRQRLRTPRDFVGLNGVSRWVVKPDDGAGAVATRVHTSFDGALADLASRRKGSLATLEPWVEGEPMSLSLLCHAGRTELISINRQCIQVNGNGILSYEGVQINAIAMDDPRAAVLRDTAQRVARAIPGLRGFAGVDIVWHPSCGPVVIEVNPRVTCAYVGLSEALRRPLAQEIVSMFTQQREVAGVA